MSIIKNMFKEQIPRWICRLPKVPLTWSPELQVLEGHSSWSNRSHSHGWEAAGVSIGWRDSEAVRHGDWTAATEARRPQALGQLGRILSGWEVAGVSVGRRDGEAVGRGNRTA